jgi:DNA-binding XRE family transcriptional regulator
MYIHARGRLDMAEVLEANRLKAWRCAAGYTQEVLAKQAVLCRTSISHVECGRYRPSVNFARKVCRALSERFKRRVEPWHVFPDNFRRPPGLEPAGD